VPEIATITDHSIPDVQSILGMALAESGIRELERS
jgi:hypothetical protein